MFKKTVMVLTLVLAVLFLFAPSWAEKDFSEIGVTPEMTASWWQWALSIPTSVHPLRADPDTEPGDVDPSSYFCMVGQHDDLFFLGGSFLQVDIIPDGAPATATTDGDTPDITRTCDVPLGTAILMPVLNAECNTAEEIYLGNLTGEELLRERIHYLRNCAREQSDEIKTAEASFGRQGEAQQPLNVTRVRTLLPFALTYAPDHILQFGTPWEPTVNPSLAFADGYWVLVKPKWPGTYELNTFGDVPKYGFSLRIKYILKIVGPQDQ